MTKSVCTFGNCRIHPFSSKRNTFLTIILIFLGNLATAQKFSYQFTVEDVTNSAEAKEITGVIRPIFNDEEEPFLYFPSYAEASGGFDFESDIDVSQAQLQEILLSNSLQLVSFKRTDREGDLAKNNQP